MLPLRRLAPITVVLALGAALLTHGGASAPRDVTSGRQAAPAAHRSQARTPTTEPVATTTGATTGATTAGSSGLRSVAVRTTTSPLPEPMHGRAAVRALGAHLPAVARLNRRSAAQLTRLLVGDPTMWLDKSGRLFVKEALPAEPVTSAFATAAQPAYPLAQTLSLHSLPGSHRTIFLDFDGVNIGASAWTSQGLASGSYQGWDPMGNGAAYDDRELAAIQEVWARVAEDYAPFDVDVTTQDPGDAALTRSDSSDLDYGTHLVVTDSSTAWQALCTSQCGGLAWVGTFGSVDQPVNYQVAWVFSGGVNNYPQAVAEAAAHEVGHTFDLLHDGTRTQGDGSYDRGHAPWAPIMGVGYYHGVTQWSKGDYADANNQQDDVATIAARAPLRTDEAGGSIATATRVPAGTAYITSRTDLDYYALGTCTGPVTVAARPAAVGADLDVVLRIVDAGGNTVATAAPATTETTGAVPWPWQDNAYVQGPVISGMDATVATSLTAGRYYAVVDGGGAQAGGGGDPVTDYDDYGSLGAYTLTTSGCTDSGFSVPGAPSNVTATITGAAGLTLSWGAPAADGGTAVVGYDVTVDGGAAERVASDVTSRSWPEITTGRHDVTVAAVNAEGAGPAASQTVRRTAPSAPVFYGTTIGPDPKSDDQSLLYFTTEWIKPEDDGGSPVLSYRVEYEIRPGVWELVREVPADNSPSILTVYGVGITLPPGWPPSNIRVMAVNEVGDSAPLVVQGQIPGPPMLLGGADVTFTPDKLARTLRIDWRDPYAGGSAILGTRVSFVIPNDSGDPSTYQHTAVQDVPATQHSIVLHDVAAGEHLIGMEPYNALGGREQTFYTTMPALLPPDPVTQFAPVAVDYDRATRVATATLGWTAPYSDPDLPILGYDVTVDGAEPVRVSGTSLTLTRDLGSTHAVEVVAVNAAGAGTSYGPTTVRMVTAPAPVTSLSASVDRSDPGNLTVNATWTASADNGGETGTPEYQWRLQPLGGDDAYWQTSFSPSLQARWVAAGRYTLEVRAHNADGDSEVVSTPVTVRATAVPGMVTNLQGEADVDAGTATVTWTAPADDGGSPIWDGFWSVVLTDQTTGEKILDTVVSTAQADLQGLVLGHTYRVAVSAQNTVGQGTPTTWTFTMAHAPGAVGAVTPTADRLERTVTVRWTPPAQTGGAPITSYKVRLGSLWSPVLAATTTSYVFDAVATGSYDVEVQADNGAGTSAAAGTVAMLAPPVAPGAVGGLRVTSDAAHGRATLTWSAPADDGGSPVTGYVVVVGSRTIATTDRTLTVTGLVLGTTYRITVAARNAAGTGTPAGQTLTPTTLPAAPRIGAAKQGRAGGSTTAVFGWSAPTVTGGSRLTGYEVSVVTLRNGKQVATKAYAVAATVQSFEVRLPKKKGLTYAAVVRVRTAVGWSPVSARSNAVVPR